MWECSSQLCDSHASNVSEIYPAQTLKANSRPLRCKIRLDMTMRKGSATRQLIYIKLYKDLVLVTKYLFFFCLFFYELEIPF